MRNELFLFTFEMLWKVISLVRALSLDIVAGACICSLFFADIMGIELTWVAVGCLGMAVWLIYTMDHLLDGFRVGDGGAFRHVFHKRYRGQIFAVWVAVAFAGLMFSFQLPASTLKAGLVLALLVLVYFMLVYQFGAKHLYHKEVFGAFVYTAGVFLPAMTVSPEPWSPVVLVLILEFFLLAFINLLLFGRMDLLYDKNQSFGSLPGLIGRQRLDLYLQVLFIVLGTLIVYGFLGWKSDPVLASAQFMMGIMCSGLVWLHVLIRTGPARLQFQLLGDSIFIVPLILLL